MNKEEILKEYLDIEHINRNKEEFDFNILLDCDDINFKNEFEKFLSMTNNFYFNIDKNYVFIFNDLPIYLDFKILKHIQTLLNISRKKDSIYSCFISEFLFTLFVALKSNKYRNELKNLAVFKKDFLSIFNGSEFIEHGSIYEKTIEFYNLLIEYIEQERIEPSILHIYRIIRKFENGSDIYKKYFDCFICENNCYALLSSDYDCEKHVDYYYEYIMGIDSIDFRFDNSYDLLLKLSQKVTIKKNILIEYSNKVIDIFNECEFDKDEQRMVKVGLFESILKCFKTIKDLFSSINSKDYAEKISEIEINILYVKRKFINKIDKSHYHSFKFEIKEFDKLIPNYQKMLLKNPWSTYNMLSIDFNKEIFESINDYSKNPLIFMTNNIEIDNVKNMYYLDSNIRKDDNISNYYEKLAKDYIQQNNKSLENVIVNNHYKNMIRNVKINFNFKLQLFRQTIYPIKNKYINYLKKIYCEEEENKYTMKYDYILIVKMIIEIEMLCKRLLHINNCNDMKNILNELFMKYNDNDLYRNGFANIYYFLYADEGLELRNQLLHGDLFIKDYSIVYAIVFSCWLMANLIFGKEYE